MKDDGLLKRGLQIKPEEWRALLWASVYFFSVLSAYYIIRPIRDEMGVEGGIDHLPWLFTGTLIAIIVANIPFAALTKKFARVKLISVSYRFFILNLLIFIGLIHFATPEQKIWIGRIFFIWTSVFNLFVVSIFWILMVDVFNLPQSKRLFGFIAAGGTFGAVVGSSVTMTLAKHVPTAVLMLSSAAILEFAVFCVRRLASLSEKLKLGAKAEEAHHPISGNVFSGISHTLSSTYLLNISLFTLLGTVTSTTLYFQQAEIVHDHVANSAERIALFAQIEVLVNTITLLCQIFFTAKILKRFGVSVTLMLVPAFSLIGFGVLSVWPTVTAIIAVQVIRRAGNFALARPAFESLFTVIPREDKYRAKAFMDTVVYRTGDQVGAWSKTLLAFFGFGATAFSLIAVPASFVWLINSYWLGKRQRALAPKAHSN